MRNSSAFCVSDFEIFGCSMKSGRKFFDLSTAVWLFGSVASSEDVFGTDLDEIGEVRGWDTVDRGCRTHSAKCRQLNRSARVIIASSRGPLKPGNRFANKCQREVMKCELIGEFV